LLKRANLLLSGDAATETLGKAVDTTTGINDFLLTGVEGVTFVAHVNVKVFTQGRTGFESVAAAAVNRYFNVIWMNFWFHDRCLDVFVPPPGRLPSTAQRLKRKRRILEAGILTESTIKASRIYAKPVKPSTHSQHQGHHQSAGEPLTSAARPGFTPTSRFNLLTRENITPQPICP